MKQSTFKILIVFLLLTGCSITPESKLQSAHQDKSQQTLAVAEAFLQAAGAGDGNKLNELMSDDFVWHNEGDQRLPWIGNWQGKARVFGEFMPAFAAGLKITSWSTDFSFASGDQAVFMGTMSADANTTGKATGVMNWAVRVHVEDGKVLRWTWLEDSYAVSKAYHDL
ncbi:MAG: nuclear transport factor 2 family protein [Pseudomonadota bacterium]